MRFSQSSGVDNDSGSSFKTEEKGHFLARTPPCNVCTAIVSDLDE